MTDEEINYAVVKYNFKTEERELFLVVPGFARASGWVQRCEMRLTERERAAGWSFHTEKLELPGTNPAGEKTGI